MAFQTSIDTQLLASFAFYATICLLKMSLVSLMTSINRLLRKVFANVEDAKAFGAKTQVNLNDPVVERIRRCHLNDMENVYLFVLLGFLYCLTNPSYRTAVWIFRVFTISRLTHMFVYLTEAQQPRRFLAWLVGFVCCWVMVVQILRTTL